MRLRRGLPAPCRETEFPPCNLRYQTLSLVARNERSWRSSMTDKTMMACIMLLLMLP